MKHESIKYDTICVGSIRFRFAIIKYYLITIQLLSARVRNYVIKSLIKQIVFPCLRKLHVSLRELVLHNCKDISDFMIFWTSSWYNIYEADRPRNLYQV